MPVWRAAKLLLTLRCEQSHQLLAESRHKKLSAVERWAVRLHLLCCSYCRVILKQLRAVDRLAHGRGEAAEPLTDEARRRIAAKLEQADRP